MNYEYEKDWWETKDHKKIKIEDMETSHIENTINYLKKHKDFYDDYCFVGWTGDGDGDGQIYDYEDNSYLADKKIEEFQYELNKREGDK